jgi:LacI family transcriptional regulator
LLGLADPPTALFAANNRNMIGALRAIKSTQASVAIASFDDFEFADVLNLPVTVVAYEPAEVGREATRLLWDRIANEGSNIPPRRVIVPTRVIDYGITES